MEKKLVLRMGFLIILAFVSLGILFSAFRATTPSVPKPASQSTKECCKKEKDADAGGNLDFESLPGKFFSTILIN